MELKIIILFFSTFKYLILGHLEVMLSKHTTTCLLPFPSDAWGYKAHKEMQVYVLEKTDHTVLYAIMKQNVLGINKVLCL